MYTSRKLKKNGRTFSGEHSADCSAYNAEQKKRCFIRSTDHSVLQDLRISRGTLLCIQKNAEKICQARVNITTGVEFSPPLSRSAVFCTATATAPLALFGVCEKY